jgi:hypothetical protein
MMIKNTVRRTSPLPLWTMRKFLGTASNSINMIRRWWARQKSTVLLSWQVKCSYFINPYRFCQSDHGNSTLLACSLRISLWDEGKPTMHKEHTWQCAASTSTDYIKTIYCKSIHIPKVLYFICFFSTNRPLQGRNFQWIQACFSNNSTFCSLVIDTTGFLPTFSVSYAFVLTTYQTQPMLETKELPAWFNLEAQLSNCKHTESYSRVYINDDSNQGWNFVVMFVLPRVPVFLVSESQEHSYFSSQLIFCAADLSGYSSW